MGCCRGWGQSEERILPQGLEAGGCLEEQVADKPISGCIGIEGSWNPRLRPFSESRRFSNLIEIVPGNVSFLSELPRDTAEQPKFFLWAVSKGAFAVSR